MNQIRAIQALNKKEIENGISPNASWHVDYRDTAYVYFGGLPYEISEGDIITIFSQFGEPVFVKLARDKESGKSKGFGWLKYEDQRSTDLAVDNIGGAELAGRMIRVDHARYQARDDEDQDEFKVAWEDMMRKEGKHLSDAESSDEEEERRPMLQEERELALLMQNHDDDDPMKAFLMDEKKSEIEQARQRAGRKEKKHKHRHHRSHKSRRHEDDDEDRPRRSHRDDTPVGEDSQRRGRDRHRDRRSRRDDPRDHSRDRDRRTKRRDDYEDERRNRDRGWRRHEREDSDERPHHRRRDDDDDDTWPRRRSRSRSPRRRDGH